jgi:citrate lyase subunit beta / citryl-CoA lyase
MSRSLLFAPGDQPAKIDKAMASGADAVIIDLEDSVAEPRKAEAQRIAAEALAARAGPRRPQAWVRINPLSAPLALDDLAAVIPGAPEGIVLPKCEGAADVMRLDEALSDLEAVLGLEPGLIRILPITTETPKAVFALGGYGGASARLAGLTWGAEDLSAAVGATASRDADGALTPVYGLARSLCLLGAAAAEVEAIDTVYPAFRDLDGLAAYAGRARRDGFSGMLAIHPAQVAIINAAFTPAPDEVDRAIRIVALFEADPEAGALALDGRMLDRPHLIQARRILAAKARADEA